MAVCHWQRVVEMKRKGKNVFLCDNFHLISWIQNFSYRNWGVPDEVKRPGAFQASTSSCLITPSVKAHEGTYVPAG